MTSADIRQIKMNYLQHNKNQVATANGTVPLMAKHMDGGNTGSKAALHQQYQQQQQHNQRRGSSNYYASAPGGG